MNRLETDFFFHLDTIFKKRFVHSYDDALKNCRQYLNDFFSKRIYVVFSFFANCC